jgi:hypothetical protein
LEKAPSNLRKNFNPVRERRFAPAVEITSCLLIEARGRAIIGFSFCFGRDATAAARPQSGL